MNASREGRIAERPPTRVRARRGFVNVVVVAVLIASARCVLAHDAFDAVHCDGDVGKALIGKSLGNERVATLEKGHSGIGLRNEGGEEISDSVFYQSWTICGATYHLLERNGVVGDALHADHSKGNPSFIGTCKVEGAPTPYPVFAILVPAQADAKHASPRDATMLHASSAWKIDESHAKFVRMDTTGLMCPLDGVATADGGP